ncbi:MAG: hypothetical protein IKB60_02525 [Clostridia bacterium]|nr:hypothetical protein [Clostridia bacterium]
MFTKIITDTLLIFFVTYAIVDILTHLLRFVNQIGIKKPDNLKLVLYVNSTDEVESLVRSSIAKSQNLGFDLLVINDNNSPEVNSITKKLKTELPYLNIINIKDDAFNQKISDVFSKDA